MNTQLSEAMGNRICICTTNSRFPCKAPFPQVMSSTHHRTLSAHLHMLPSIQGEVLSTNKLPLYKHKDQKNHSLEHTWLILRGSKRVSWQALKAVRKQLLKATSNFSYCVLLYQILFKGLSRQRKDKERLNFN